MGRPSPLTARAGDVLNQIAVGVDTQLVVFAGAEIDGRPEVARGVVDFDVGRLAHAVGHAQGRACPRDPAALQLPVGFGDGWNGRACGGDVPCRRLADLGRGGVLVVALADHADDREDANDYKATATAFREAHGWRLI